MATFSINRSNAGSEAGSSKEEGNLAVTLPLTLLRSRDRICQTEAQKPESRWLRTREFAIQYGVTPSTARRWVRERKLKAVQVPPCRRGKIYILDPGWTIIDPQTSNDPAEWLCVLRQVDVARLLGISSRALRYLEKAGKANYRQVGHRKLYSLGEVRRLLAQRQNGRDNVTRRERQMSLFRWALWKLNGSSEPQI